jgi:DNA polymerase III subunit epsilon
MRRASPRSPRRAREKLRGRGVRRAQRALRLFVPAQRIPALDRHFSAKVLCTVKLSRRLFPEHQRHNLDAVMERHGLQCARGIARSAMRACCGISGASCARVARPRSPPRYKRCSARTHCRRTCRPSSPTNCRRGPASTVFSARQDALLYIGKSVSLRTRVLAHFAAEHTDSKEQRLAREVRRIDWVRDRRRARRAAARSCLDQGATASAQSAPQARPETYTLRGRRRRCRGLRRIDRRRRDRGGRLARCFGLFRSRKDARKALTDIARAQQLCLKVLGLEQSDGSCFALPVGKCRGACVGKEPLALHACVCSWRCRL